MSNEQWSEWIEHNTNGCPVDGGMIVDIMKRDEKESGDHVFYPDLASNWDWSVDDVDGDIIAYRYRLDDNTMTPEEEEIKVPERNKVTSDGTTASYYELPEGATELYHLIIHKNMNAQLGEIFRAAYRYGESSHSDQLRDARKIKAYIEQEIERLEKRCIG